MFCTVAAVSRGRCCVVGFERSAGVTRQPDGVIGTKTYGRVGVNKENLLVYLLDRNNELKRH